MLARDSVKSRLNSEEGCSFTELAYQTLQAYDFLHLHREHGCILQLGGSDQWGNITAGIDLIRRHEGGQAWGVTMPLLTTASGEKLGKSAGNAVWLDPKLTSAYHLYQYLLNLGDGEASTLLMRLGPVDKDFREIEEIIDEHATDPALRLAQKSLAAWVTEMVHGEKGGSLTTFCLDRFYAWMIHLTLM